MRVTVRREREREGERGRERRRESKILFFGEEKIKTCFSKKLKGGFFFKICHLIKVFGLKP